MEKERFQLDILHKGNIEDVTTEQLDLTHCIIIGLYNTLTTELNVKNKSAFIKIHIYKCT